MEWLLNPALPRPSRLGLPAGACTAHATVDGVRLSSGVAHVNNAEYVRWVDELAALHAVELGHGRPEMLHTGRMWFVARHELDFRAECFAGDHLHAATWIERVDGARAWRRTAIWRPTEQIVLTALTAWALVDLASRRPVPLRSIRGAIATP
ncbi:MAG: acyl-CoA thioesterase [Planctomycetes bacterium]|nr:acyl-CoA thioesterase [Planctomycetota bacterium]